MSIPEVHHVVDLLVALWPQDTWQRTSALLATWRETLDRKDNYSGHHAGLATEYAIQLAHRQDLPYDTIAALWVGGHVYDLGKISVPEHVLTKDGPLSNAEMMVVRGHTTTGYELVRDWDVLRVSPRWMSQVVLQVVLHHHERWDGAGYPRGLREKEIPLPARIMTVADAYAAMIMDTPYRRARAEALALQELERHAGEQFDPYLVRSFISMVRVNQLTGRGPQAGERAADAA
jgi:HD-GYP domain-containing protein (c-di-GMP phosphodiesterase class II)